MATTTEVPATRRLAALELRRRADVHRERRDFRRMLRAVTAATRLERRPRLSPATAKLRA